MATTTFDPEGFGQVMIERLNSATKYPSILTYHALDPKNGQLLEDQPTAFPSGSPVVLTEKVDGASGRVIVLPDGDFFIGSREELLYAKGDRIENPALSLVPTLLPLAGWLKPLRPNALTVYFLEVYGHGIGGAAKQYTVTGKTGYRLFDVASVPLEILYEPREKISSWREHGGQEFAGELALMRIEEQEGVPLTPRLSVLNPADLPRDLPGMELFLHKHAPHSLAALDAGSLGAAEGIVLRSYDRSVIAKARFQDYRRTLHPQPQRKKEGKQWRKDAQDTASSTS